MSLSCSIPRQKCTFGCLMRRLAYLRRNSQVRFKVRVERNRGRLQKKLRFKRTHAQHETYRPVSKRRYVSKRNFFCNRPQEVVPSQNRRGDWLSHSFLITHNIVANLPDVLLSPIKPKPRNSPRDPRKPHTTSYECASVGHPFTYEHRIASWLYISIIRGCSHFTGR